MKTGGIRAYWIQEPADQQAVKPERYVKVGALLMPLIGPPAPEPERQYKMPSGDLEALYKAAGK